MMYRYLGGLIKSVVLATILLAGANAQQTWTVNFNDSDIQEVIKFVANASGRTLIIDPRVKGRVKVISANPMAADELYDLFLSVLEVHGFTAIEVGNVTRIVPRKDARSSPVPVTATSRGIGNNEYVTQVVQLHNVAAVKVLPVLRPLVPQHAHLAAYDPSNAIIVSDTAANIERIRDLIERIDKAAIASTDVVALQHAQAEEVVRILTQLERTAGGKKGGTTSQLVLVADKRTNAVLVSGDDLQRARITSLVKRLDKPQEHSGNVRVVYLEYADATETAQTLSKVVQNLGKVSAGDKAGAKSQATVEADEDTNALLITADGGVLPAIMEVVKKLDIRRAQVLVEAIIVEIEGGQDNALGIQWLFQNGSGGVSGSSLGDGALGNVASGILGSTEKIEKDKDGNVITTKTSNAAQLGAALAGNKGQLFGVGKITSNTNFLLLLNALEQNTGSNILSTPNLLTTDNHEATITVGQNVPFVTGSFSSTGSGGGSTPQNPFQTIERQNVGITLQVTPHVNKGDTVRLDLVQEISSLSGATVQASDVITNERKIETQIMAKDGEIVVLGGLIKDDIQESEQRVPFLGSIPVIGRLFRSDSTKVTKTNLLVFIRPTVIRDEKTLEGATAEKYRYIREQQLRKRQKGAKLIKDRTVLPLLPEWKDRSKTDKSTDSGETATTATTDNNTKPIDSPDTSSVKPPSESQPSTQAPELEVED